MAVTFDDLPFVNHSNHSVSDIKNRTVRLLDVFKEYKIPAVGFVNEYKVYDNGKLNEGRVSVLREWIKSGFELGNHTFSHKSLNNVSVREYEEDIRKGETILKDLMSEYGKNIRYFRYPFLQKGNEEYKKIEIEKYLKKAGYINAPVTFDNSEWVFARAYEIALQKKDSSKMEYIGDKYVDYISVVFDYFEKQTMNLFERQIKHILLLHANSLNSDYFNKICIMISGRGYHFISLDEALEDPIYEKEENYVGNWGFSWINRWALTDGKGRDFYKEEPEPDDEIFKLAGMKNR